MKLTVITKKMKTKKDQKSEYKLMKFPVGVFQIRNTINDKVYIDSSIDLNSIWNRHRFQLNFGSHPNKELQKEWKELGEENFIYEIVSTIDQDDASQGTNFEKEAKELAQMIIEDLQPYGEKGYMIKK